MRDPILITGASRSGVSMTAGVVYFCGAFGGDVCGTKGTDGAGMFGNIPVRDSIMTPYLKQIGADLTGQCPLPNTSSLISAPLLKNIFEFEIKRQGCGEDSLAFYKDFRLCLVWPIWHDAFPNAKWIIVRRAGVDVVASCLKTGYMKAYKSEFGWNKWLREYLDRFDEMINTDLSVTEVWPTKFVEGDFTEIKAVVNKLGLQWNEERITAFLNPKTEEKTWQRE